MFLRTKDCGNGIVVSAMRRSGNTTYWLGGGEAMPSLGRQNLHVPNKPLKIEEFLTSDGQRRMENGLEEVLADLERLPYHLLKDAMTFLGDGSGSAESDFALSAILRMSVGSMNGAITSDHLKAAAEQWVRKFSQPLCRVRDKQYYKGWAFVADERARQLL